MILCILVSGGWPERENVHANRLLAILDMYKAVVLLEKQQKEKDKRKQRIGYSSLTVSKKLYTMLKYNMINNTYSV